MYRSELERLMTLASDDIDTACRGDCLPDLITRCIDESLELVELAESVESALGRNADHHAYYVQEAAAWRATARLLRLMAADGALRHESGAA